MEIHDSNDFLDIFPTILEFPSFYGSDFKPIYHTFKLICILKHDTPLKLDFHFVLLDRFVPTNLARDS